LNEHVAQAPEYLWFNNLC